MTLSHNMSLNSLLVFLGLPPLLQEITITGLTLDSRQLKRGELFLAVPGFSVDGRDFIELAAIGGAAAVLAEADGLLGRASAFGQTESDENIPVIAVNQLKGRIGALAGFFYQNPNEYLRLIGITGTNGKTSCSWFVAQLLSLLGQPCAVMGTVGQGIPPDVSPCLNTTSDALSTQAFMAGLVAQNTTSLAMEVSSHGLDQGRVDGLRFDVGVFTNLSRDHLDYHKTIEAYARTKARLFEQGRVKTAVINVDDAYAPLMRAHCSPDVRVVGFSTQASSEGADVVADHIVLNQNGVQAQVTTPWGTGVLKTPLLGRFNLQNLLAVVTAVCSQGYELSQVLKLVPSLTAVPGRMQRLGGGHKPLVVVDYAHTSGALKSVLVALKEYGATRIICVFGCGGDRDRGKRPLMMRSALGGADQVIVTSDNPRTEQPDAIIADTLEGAGQAHKHRFAVITDRAEAIRSAINNASVGDIVVIAGKGHEDYQEINGHRYPFSDSECVVKALASWSNGEAEGSGGAV